MVIAWCVVVVVWYYLHNWASVSQGKDDKGESRIHMKTCLEENYEGLVFLPSTILYISYLGGWRWG